jgi:hypothetical protein
VRVLRAPEWVAELNAQPLRPVKRKPAADVGTDPQAFRAFARSEGVTVPLTAKDHFLVVPPMAPNASSPPQSLHKAVQPGSGRTPERAESLHLFRQKRKAVWPLREEPYASAQVY